MDHEESLGTVVTGMLENSSAEKAGIQIGEAVLSVDDIKVNDVYELRASLKGKLGQNVNVELKDIKNDYIDYITLLIFLFCLQRKTKICLLLYLVQ
jgi:S1-C subfamily serine protease